MTTIESINRISVDLNVRGGQPCIVGTSLRVIDIVIANLFHKRTPDEVASDYELSLAQVYAALAYYFEHKDALDIAIHHQLDVAQSLKKQKPINAATPYHSDGNTQMSINTHNIDRELIIQFKSDSNHYIATLRDTTGSECSITIDLSIIDSIFKDLAKPSNIESESVLTIGSQLFHSVFHGEAKQLFIANLEKAKLYNGKLYLLIDCIDTPELSNLPWEYLYDFERSSFWLLSTAISLIRIVKLSTKDLIPTLGLPLRILVVLSSPIDFSQLNLTQEWEMISDSLRTLTTKGLIKLECLREASLKTLQHKLQENNYHIIHFSGPGSYDPIKEEGYLFFEDEQRYSNRVGTEEFSLLLSLAHEVRLVILNSSEGSVTSSKNFFKGIAQSLIQRGVPFVIATQKGILDEVAVNFAREFYRNLGNAYPIDECFSRACKTIYLRSPDNLYWGYYTLFADINYKNALNVIKQIDLIQSDVEWLQASTGLDKIRDVHRFLSSTQILNSKYVLFQDISKLSIEIDRALDKRNNFEQRLALMSIERVFSTFMAKLTQSNEYYNLELQSILLQWSKLIRERIQELNDIVNIIEEIDNPYVVGQPLNAKQEVFVGRTDIGRHIEQMLLDQRRPSLFLYGQRRMGKTSLLYNLEQFLPMSIVPVRVDLQRLSLNTDFANFLYELAQNLIEFARQKRGMKLSTSKDDSFAQAPFNDFNRWLDTIETELGDTTVLLMFDEFEALHRAFERGRYDAEDVLGMLRHLIQHRPKFKVLLVGSHTITEYQLWSNYLINLQTIHISYLRDIDARQLIERPVKDFNLHYIPAASQRIVDLTHCHPCLVQLLCSEIIFYKNEQDPNIRYSATPADVEAAVPEALTHGSMFFADIERNQVDDDGRTILRKLASCGEGGVVDRDQLAQVCPERLEETLTLLQQRELIEPVEGGYRFQVELIRRWFAQ